MRMAEDLPYTYEAPGQNIFEKSHHDHDHEKKSRATFLPVPPPQNWFDRVKLYIISHFEVQKENKYTSFQMTKPWIIYNNISIGRNLLAKRAIAPHGNIVLFCSLLDLSNAKFGN